VHIGDFHMVEAIGFKTRKLKDTLAMDKNICKSVTDLKKKNV